MKVFTSLKLFFVIATLASTSAFAQSKPNVSYSMPALEFGFKWNSMDVSGASSSKQSLGFQLGASSVFDFAPSFGLKTGLFYSERPFVADFSGTETKGKMTYFEVPAFFMFKFEDYAGIYLGPSLAIKLSHEVNTGTLDDVKGMIVPITFGAQFKFMPNMGLNLFFETIPSDIAKNYKNSRAVGVNFLLTFD